MLNKQTKNKRTLNLIIHWWLIDECMIHIQVTGKPLNIKYEGGVVVHFNPAEEEVWLIKQYCVFVPQTSMHIYPYT